VNGQRRDEPCGPVVGTEEAIALPSRASTARAVCRDQGLACHSGDDELPGSSIRAGFANARHSTYARRSKRCYRLFGAHDWAARLVPALSVHGCVLLVFLFGRRWLGERAALWGALTLGLAPGFLGMGRLLVLDGLLALWTTFGRCSALFELRFAAKSYTAVGGRSRPERARWAC